MDHIGFGVVGCGRVSEKHLQSIRDADKSRLVAVCDVVEEKARDKGEKYGVPWYTSMEAMVEAQPGIDVIDILTPSGDHAATTLAALDMGKHVLVEKPMALTLDDAEAMILKADRAGRRLFVVKQNRYNKPVVRARQLFDEGAFGQMVMGTVRVRWCRPQAYYDRDEWRGTWRWDGGVLSNQASHHIDLLQWFMGEPESVYAVGRTALVDIECEDTAAAVIQFRGGAVGIVEATNATRPRDLEGSLSLMGSKGSVVIGGFAVNQVQAWQFEDRETPADVLTDLSTQPPDVYGFGHRQVIENVCESLQSDTAALVEGWEGMKSLRLTMAFYESIETGKPISMRFRPNRCRLGRDSNGAV